jgi:hypothetical protein
MGMLLRAPTEAWDQRRWTRILDRMEHRQANVGLRFWGPPLWLEITMSGPDSEQWLAAESPGIEQRSWDWQSLAVCPDLAELTLSGADDERLLAVVSRYAIENLILNATHEIGEWLRFDAQRVFPAHTTTSDSPPAFATGGQGNGPVRLVIDFGARLGDPSAAVGAGTEAALLNASRRAAAVAAAWRFTYLPGLRVSYGRLGPDIMDTASPLDTLPRWSDQWSPSTLSVADGATDDLVEAIVRDVHRLVVRFETDRVCRAFHVDGRQIWRLAQSDGSQPGVRRNGNSPDTEPLSVTVVYATEEGRL